MNRLLRRCPPVYFSFCLCNQYLCSVVLVHKMNFIILIHVNGGKRIRSSLNGNLGLTPPIKTTNMAATSPVQSQPVFLQVLSQAYESYPSPYGQPLPYDGSPNHLQITFTLNPINSNPVAVQQLPAFSSHTPIGHSTPAPVSNLMILRNTHPNPYVKQST